MTNYIIDNDFVKEFITLHTTKKTCENKMQELRQDKPCGTYVYQGKENKSRKIIMIILFLSIKMSSFIS